MGVMFNTVQGNVLRFLSPLILTVAQVDEAMDVLEGVMAEMFVKRSAEERVSAAAGRVESGAALESCFVLVDDVRIHVRRAGAGPALLMVHGLIADSTNWALNVPALTGLRTVYALDLMNMGQSARVAGADAGLAATADWLGRVMDGLGLEKADLVGSSHGGAVCLMFAALHGSRVRSLVLFAQRILSARSRVR